MRILVTGASGMLGTDVVVAGRDSGAEVTGVDRADLDITNLSLCRAVIAAHGPDVVINCAAFTDVDGAESDPESAFRVNAIGPQNLAIACRAAGAVLVQVSTDYVFDGSSTGPYTEFDTVGPINVYGASKLAGEIMVRGLRPEHFIIRSSWLYGRNGRNFVDTMVRLSAERDELNVVADQIGSPTYTMDLASAMMQVIDSGAFGTYNVTNQASCSWHSFAQQIFRSMELDPNRVRAITTAEFPRPAARPRNSVLRNFCMELRGFPLLRPWQAALDEYLEHRSA